MIYCEDILVRQNYFQRYGACKVVTPILQFYNLCILLRLGCTLKPHLGHILSGKWPIREFNVEFEPLILSNSHLYLQSI